jgi:cytoskeletal protein RodZ
MNLLPNDQQSPEHDFDALLDAALRERSSVDADEAFEQRLINRVRAAQVHPRRWPQFSWAVAVVFASVFVLLFASALWVRFRQRTARFEYVKAPPPASSSVSPDEEAVADAQVVIPVPRSTALRPAVVRSTRVSRGQRFPAPVPLTHQERLLIAYIKAADPGLTQLARIAPPVDTPITIQPLEISAIQIPKLADHE